MTALSFQLHFKQFNPECCTVCC